MPNRREQAIIGFALAYGSGTEIDEHSHSAHQLIHAISGTMRVTVGRALWFLPLGRGLWLPADTPHAIRCEGEVQMRTVYLSQAYPDVPTEARMVAVTPLMREALVRLSDAQCHAALQSLLGRILLHEIARETVEPLCLPLPEDPRIASMLAHFRNDPHNKTPLSGWARLLGFSERSLIRCIRNETGMTFRDLRRHSRILVAIERLSDGQPATKVALDVGFETPSAFSFAFKQITGKSPRAFQAQLKPAL